MTTPTLYEYEATVSAIVEEALSLHDNDHDIHEYIRESVGSSEWTFKHPHMDLIANAQQSSGERMLSDCLEELER